MTYWIKKRDGRVFKGKSYSQNWNEVWRSMSYGDKLYNPYTQKCVIGWNEYRRQLSSAQQKIYKNKK